jgi:hypothetical protein
MADNIKIIGNIINTTTAVSRYSSEDTNLIFSQKIQENFGGKDDYIEYYTYDIGGNLLYIDYSYLNYKLPPNTGLTPGTSTPPNTTGNIQTEDVGIDSTLVPQTSSLYPIIEIDPVNDLQNLGYSSGEFNVKYNFFTNVLSNYVDRALFVKEISQDRTEIRLASTTLTDNEIESVVNSMIDKINNTTYYVDYLLNFGTNEQYVAINVALNKTTTGYEVLFKLYQPLPLSVQDKQTLWVVEEKVSQYDFEINLDKFVLPAPALTLRGPNFGIEIPNQGTVSTTYNTYSSLVSGLQSLQNNSYQQILNLLATQSVNINVDYTDFNNFTFFGSAYHRLANFYTKVQEIEGYNNFIATYSSSVAATASLQTTINQYSSSINTIITQFDGYENYLYFESSSYTWPKSGSLKPYSLLSSTDPIVISWYNALTLSAQDYDLNNYNNLEYAIPEFLKNDDNNQPFLTFLNMVGHYFDNIWVYLKAITDINVANNNLNAGISKDLVYEHLKSLGLHLYNSQAGESVDQYLIGANTGSSIWNNDTSITGSYLNNIPRKDLVAELYKRIYHNLPLLLKTKGTVVGLEHLITTFGLTSSILNVKEFGGSVKSGLVKGYNNDKVRIIPNSIIYNTIYSGSVLSPLLSLQTYPTAAAEFRENDMHYIDMSFSPQTQIDTYISGAIASNNPTWSLDNYIGDPRQLYNRSYSDLDNQRKLYFQTGVPGFAPFTASLLDYNGFIRLIQYFDNSLFKMLEDFVPERASLSTGVTINSPVLERNKVAYANPTNSTTQSVLTAQYSTSTISSEYGNFYNALSSSNNTIGWYDGELSGSTVDVHQYFVDNYNPYLGDWNVWNLQHPVTQSINQNSFLHSDWNVLLNNVSKSVQSIYRETLDLSGKALSKVTRFGVSIYQDILYPSELQDSYLSLRSYNTSRYEGCKTTSLLYNNYTSATGSYGGDDSYGKTAAIDHTVRKIGLFTQIASSSLLPKRNLVALKYLVDEFGNLTELNQINKNWWDVQRTFIMDDTASISLFDNKKFSNQKSTDGGKLIFDSGYFYTPVLYGTGKDSRLYFDHVGDSPTYSSTANFLSSSYYVSGSSTLGFPVVTIGGNRYVSRLYNNVIEGADDLNGGTSTAFPVYTVPEGGSYTVSADLTMTMKNTNNYGSASFTLQTYLNGSTYGTGDTQVFSFTAPASSYTGYNGPYLTGVAGTTITGTPVKSIKALTLTYPAGTTVIPAGTWFYRFNTPMDTVWDLGAGCVPGTGNVNIFANNGYALTQTLPLSDKSASCPLLYLPKRIAGGGTLNGSIFNIPDFLTPLGEQTVTKTFNISFRSPTTLTAGDKISASLELDYIQSGIAPYYTASITPGSTFQITSVSSLTGNYPYTTIEYFVNPEDSDLPYSLAQNQLAFTPGLTSFYSPEYQFIPYWVSGSSFYSSSLYSQYGDVDYPFQLDTFDIFAAYDVSGSYFETRISSVEKVVGSLGNNRYIVVTFVDDMPDTLGGPMLLGGQGGQLVSLLANKAAKFLFIKRVPDETSAYLKFKKRPGQTSYGFLVPENLAKDVLDNIDTITKQVKQKLVNDQGSILGDVNGGGF